MDTVPFSVPDIIEILRTQVPDMSDITTRITYTIKIIENKKWTCCEPNQMVDWYSLTDIINGKIDTLWGKCSKSS